jgi:hypothetical protein
LAENWPKEMIAFNFIKVTVSTSTLSGFTERGKWELAALLDVGNLAKNQGLSGDVIRNPNETHHPHGEMGNDKGADRSGGQPLGLQQELARGAV